MGNRLVAEGFSTSPIWRSKASAKIHGWLGPALFSGKSRERPVVQGNTSGATTASLPGIGESGAPAPEREPLNRRLWRELAE